MELSNIWENNCLFCLQESDFELTSIYSDDGDCLLFQKIDQVTDFQIEHLKHKLYPEKICKFCYNEFKIAYKFIKKAEFSKNILDQFFNKISECLKLASEDLNKDVLSPNEICKNCIDENKNLHGTETMFFNIVQLDSDNEDYVNEELIIEPISVESKKDIVRKKAAQKAIALSKKRASKRQAEEQYHKVMCDLCGNYYKATQLKYHRMRHDTVKSYPCEICNRRFATNTDLRRHMRVHTGEKPYGCKFCERKFSDFGSRIKHERCHTGEKPYKCQTCGKCFTYSYSLAKHDSVHTGYKEFTCHLCQIGFTKKQYLVNHLKKHTEWDRHDKNLIVEKLNTFEDEQSGEVSINEDSNLIVEEVISLDENSGQYCFISDNNENIEILEELTEEMELTKFELSV